MRRWLFCLVGLLTTSASYAQTTSPFFGGTITSRHYLTRVTYDTVAGKVLVPVVIRGKTYRFIVDTGAPTAISERLFNTLRPSVIRKLHITDANNASDSLSIVSVDSLTLGDITFSGIRALVAGQNVIFDCFEADGFIGSNILRNSIIQFNHQALQLTITDSEKQLTLNKKQSAKLFLSHQASPYIWIGLQSKKKVKEQVLFDTGMGSMYDMSLRSFNRFREYHVFIEKAQAIGSNSFGFFGAAADTLQYRLQLPELEINGAILKNAPAETTVDDHSRIGSDLLRYGVVTIDYKNRKFYFAPFAKESPDLTTEEFPIGLMPRDGKLWVGFVWDKTLEDRVRRGDQILSIDGISYEQTNLCELMLNPFSFIDRQHVTVKLKNAQGEVRELVITRR